jgi:GT2 family glycosyltransferase
VNTTIDVIIPTFKRPHAAASLVQTLEKSLKPGDEIIIVWQGAQKPEFEERPGISFIHSSPPNLPKARNRGLAKGKGDIALFLDDDVEVLSEDLLDIHRRVHRDAAIGAIAGFVDDPLFVQGSASCSTYDATTGEIVQNFSLTWAQDAISVMGAHMSFKKTALADVGGFDENFKKNALWEDVDCAFRIREKGWRIRFCPQAKVRHAREISGGCRMGTGIGSTYHQFANTAYFAARHAPRAYYRSWLRFWKYRLEFMSRRRFLFFRHDPCQEGAGIAGALGGIARYLTRSHHRNPS